MDTETTSLFHQKWFLPTTIGALAFSGGMGLGYILGKRIVSNQYKARREEILREGGFSTNQLNLFDPVETILEAPKLNAESIVRTTLTPPQSSDQDEPFDWILETEAEWMLEEDEIEEAILAAEKKPEIVNVFAGNDSDWDYEAELSTRTREKPYVIHQDEFINDEMGYAQETLTYYAGDDIMADTKDTPIYNHSGLLGDLNFGHGSNDKNVVYIRNEVLRIEWEVLLHQGLFEVEVLGYQAEEEIEKGELRHSVMKFRQE